MNRWTACGLVFILLGALALRAPQLDQRPMHNDEAVNAQKFDGLWESGRYVYDPNEFHGPTLPYATLLPASFHFSRPFTELTERTFRLVPVLFGTALILLLPLFAPGLGQRSMLAAAGLLAISPAMVFYSRYYIHEMLLVFFTAVVLAACWRYYLKQRLRWAVLAGIGAALMYATKETFVLSLGAIAAGFGAILIRQPRNAKTPAQFVPWNHLLAAIAAGLAVGFLFFSSFFTHPSGFVDSIRTYLPWLHRAGGESPHQHPWYFYFQRLLFFHTGKGPIWSEGFILLLACIGAASAGTRWNASDLERQFAKILAVYAASLTLAYTCISYKTPWCALSFWWGIILLAGIGADSILRWTDQTWKKSIIAVLLGAGSLHLSWQAWRASYPLCASPLNPYVYAQTSPDLLNLTKKIDELADVSPDGRNMIIKIMADHGDYWPLPWYLRQFQRVGWWDKIPADPFAPVMVVSSNFDARFDERPNKTHLMAGYFQLRPLVFFELYVETNLWRAYVASRPPPTDSP